MADLDRTELAKLLAPLAEATGLAFAVDDRAGAELAGVGGPEGTGAGAGPERAPVVIRAEIVAYVRTATPEAARGAGRLLSEVLGRRRYMELEMENLAAELLGRYEEVTLLHGLSRALGSVFDIPTVSQIALDKALQVVPAQRALVAVEDEDGGALVVTAARGGLEPWVGRALPEHGLSAEIVATGRRTILHDDEPWREGDRPEREPGDALLSVPLLLTSPDGDDRAIGALTLVGRGPSERFSAGDASLAGAGLLTPVADPRATARAVTRLLSDRDLHARLLAAGRARAHAAHGVQQMAAGYEFLYRRVAGPNTGM